MARMNVQLEKIVKIREAKKLSQVAVSKLMGYAVSQICQIERGERPFTGKSLERFKDVLGLQGVPISNDEVLAFELELHKWKDSILAGDIDNATERQSFLKFCVQWSYEPSLSILYELYNTVYYRFINDMENFNKTLSLLSDKTNDFSQEHYYWYHSALGYHALVDGQYQKALKEFFKAELLDNSVKVTDESLRINIAQCLTHMGYTYIAIDYLEKAKHYTAEKFNNVYNTLIQLLLAVNFRNIDKIEPSLTLSKCGLRDKKEQGAFYLNMAESYNKIGDFDKAIEHVDKALDYYKNNESEHAYVLYRKANILASIGRTDESHMYLSEGLRIFPSDDTRCGLLLNTLKHSMQLHDAESVRYVMKTAVPKLEARGLYLEAMEHYEKLSKHYEGISTYKRSLVLTKRAFEIHQKLTKGVLTVTPS